MIHKEWHSEALSLRDKGFSGRAIANIIGKSKSQVNEFLKNSVYTWSEEVVEELSKSIIPDGPKVLVYDIETAPMLSYCWGLWDQNIGLNQIHTDWHLLSWAAKWLHSDDIFYEDQRNAVDIEDDKQLLQGIWKLLDEADFVITQNGKKFDQKKLNARFVFHGMKPPSSYRHIDVLLIAKAQFGFSSNKLAFMTDKLCTKYKKSTHAKFHGFELWRECLAKNEEAFDEMMDYNCLDILSLQELFEILAPWDTKLPVFEVYKEEVVENDEWVKSGFVYSNAGKYDRYRNTVTGQQRRGKVNLLSKDKRQSLLSNIV